MCFGGGGPSQAEKESAAKQRAEAEEAKQTEIRERAEKKREDISEAVTQRTQRRYGRGGTGRRSLFRAGGSGFLGRFG